jgi:hypothetical protein
MKKNLLIIIILVSGITVSRAQLTKVGGGISYNTGYYFNNEEFSDHKTGNPVISLISIYELSLPVHIKPSVNVFIPRVSKFEDLDYYEKRVVSAFSVDMDGHYVFNYLDRFEFYALGGFNIKLVRMKYKYEFPGASDVSTSSNTMLGFNIGGGSYIKIKEEFDAYFEVKAVVAKQLQAVISAGILLNIEWMKENEGPVL